MLIFLLGNKKYKASDFNKNIVKSLKGHNIFNFNCSHLTQKPKHTL